MIPSKVQASVVIGVAFLATNLWCALWQRPITYNGGKGFDGVVYYDLARQFVVGGVTAPRLYGPAPYVFRSGVPLLVAVFSPENLLDGFRRVNLAANAVLVVLLYWWLASYLRNWSIRVIVLLMFIFQWHAPIRIIWFYPVLTDSWGLCFLVAGLLVIRQMQIRPNRFVGMLSSFLCLVGVFFRETMLVVGLAAIFASNPVKTNHASLLGVSFAKVPLRSLFPLVACVAGFAATHVLSVQTNNYSFVRTLVEFAYTKPLLSYVHAWFVTFGPVIILVVYCWRTNLRFLSRHQFQSVFLLVFAGLAWVGGTDTERILFGAMPVIYVLIGMAIEEAVAPHHSIALVATMSIAQILSQRLFWVVPDYPGGASSRFPLLAPLGNNVPYLDLWSSFAHRSVGAVSLLQYCIVALLIVLWLRWLSRAQGAVDI